MELNRDFYMLNKTDITELETLLLVDGELQIVSFEQLNSFSQNDIGQFCVKYGFYVIPTTELIQFLRDEIGAESLDRVMEIGAGHGAICKELNIRGIDNFMQQKPEIRALYESLNQTIVPYGSHVEKMDGNDAVRKYKPSIVIGAYCTHKYNEREHWRGGNVYGFKEKEIIDRVYKYIHIGNRTVHGKKPIVKFPHREIKADWIVTRSQNKNENVIWIWEK